MQLQQRTAEDILRPLKIPETLKAQAWNAFEQSADEDQLVEQLAKIPLPADVKAQLWELKSSRPRVTVAPAAPNPNQEILAAQAKKFPTSAEQGGKPGAVAPVNSNYGLNYVPGIAKDLLERGTEFAKEKGPAIAGAIGGGIIGSAAGPGLGTLAGAGAGATAMRSLQQLNRYRTGDPKAPQTSTDAAVDLGQTAIEGVLQEVGGPIASKYGQILSRAAAGGAPEVLAPAVTRAGTRLLQTRARLTPAEQRAVDLGRAAGIPMTAGVRSGSSVARGTEAAMSHIPGAAGYIDSQKAAGEEAFTALGQRITAGIGPEADRLSVGADIRSRITTAVRGVETAEDQARDAAITTARDLMGPRKTFRQLMADLRTAKEGSAQIVKDTADEAYTAFRRIANDPANAITTHTGEVVHSPVSLEEAKAALRPLMERLERQSSTALREASPGYQALRAFMELPDYISADQAISELSAIQNLAREQFPAMRTAGQGVAARVVPLFRRALDATADALGADARAALDAGREATRLRHATFGTKVAQTTAAKIESKPIKALISDLSITNIDSMLAQTMGAELPAIRRAVFDSLVEKASTGGTLDAQKLARSWNGISAEVRARLFTPEQIAAMDQATSLQMLYGPEHPAVSLMNLMATEPARLVDTLTANADKSAETLRKIAIVAPEQMPALGRATVEAIIEKAMTTSRFMGDQAFANWNKLGLETKRLLLGGDMRRLEQVDAFFQLGKMQKATANPSGTAKVGALAGYGAGVVSSLTAVAMRPGLDTAGAAVMTIAGVPLTANMIARLLYSDGGARLLTEGLKVPASSSLSRGIAQRILGRIPTLTSSQPAPAPVLAQ